MESVNSSEIITYNDLDKVMVIDDKRFRLMCATVMINGNHFIAIIDFQNVNYYVNAKGRQCIEMPPFEAERLKSRRVSDVEKSYRLKISTVLYYLID